ncbi:MAG: dockerin type I repeat-containing protein [Candidatus Omnitrophica bacterium]|nr:dockerin type I repeat-containing protein [Candidatus Omnitrophota bacterium]
MRYIFFVMALILLTAGNARAQGVTFTVNNFGLRTLTYNGWNFADANVQGLTGITYTLADGNVITSTKAVSGSLDSDQSGALVTYPWGTIHYRYQASDNRLLVSAQVSNTSTGTISDVSIDLMHLILPSAPSQSQYDGVKPLLKEPREDAPVVYLSYATGAIAVANDGDLTKPLTMGFPLALDRPANTIFQLMVNSGKDGRYNPEYYGQMPSIPPAGSQMYQISVRFGQAISTPTELAGDIYRKFSALHPLKINWPDRRPIGMDGLGGGGIYSTVTNPRGYLLKPDEDYTSTAGKIKLRQDLLARADAEIAVLKTIHAQGIILWDLEGHEFSISLIGDPRKLPVLSPEMDAVADEFIKKYRDAGFKVGMTIRPNVFSAGTNLPSTCTDGQVFVKTDAPFQKKEYVCSAGAWVQQTAGDQQTMTDYGPDFLDKIKYAHDRWGATIFYLDSYQAHHAPFTADAMAKVLEVYPDVLLIPERRDTTYYSVSAPFITPSLDGYGTPEYASLVYPGYPGAVSVVRVVAPDYDKLLNSARRGDILLVNSWYLGDDQRTVQQIYETISKNGFLPPSVDNMEFNQILAQYPEIGQLLANAVVINAVDYGVVPDAADNTTALIRMRNALIAQGANTFFEIHFPPGVYKYTNNQWLKGLKTGFKLIGYGAQFQNIIQGAPWGVDNIPLRLGNVFEAWPLDKAGCCSYIPAHRVKPALAGSTTLEFVTPADSTDYKAGDRILLYGFDQQFYGAPPNARYFEHTVVSNVDTFSGSVTLTKPLQNSYLDTWRDTVPTSSQGIGKPRIINKDHRLQVSSAHLIYLEGVEFLDNTNSSSGKQSYFAADYVVLRNVTFDANWSPQVSELTIAQNSGTKDGAPIEEDKLIDKFYYLDRNVPTSIIAGTGVNFSRIARSSLLAPSLLAARSMEYEDNTFIIPVGNTGWPFGQYPQPYPIHQVVFKGTNSVINQSATPLSRVFSYDGNRLFPSTTISGTGGELYISEDATAKALVSVLSVGDFIRSPDGKIGRVTGIDYDTATSRFIIRNTVPLPHSNIFSVFTVQSIQDNGKVVFSPTPTKSWMNWMFTEPNWRYPAVSVDPRNSRGVVFVPENAINWRRGYWYWPWYAPITKVVVDITKAYTGSDPRPYLALFRTDSNNVSQSFGTIDLRTVGKRVVTPSQVTGAQPNDKFTMLSSMSGWTNIFQLVMRQDPGNISGTDAEMPVGTIEVDADTSLEPLSDGDVSGNGAVTMFDAALALKFSIAPGITGDASSRADLDHDGVVTSVDSAAIARKALGLN